MIITKFIKAIRSVLTFSQESKTKQVNYRTDTTDTKTKDTNRKPNYRPISLMNIGTETSIKQTRKSHKHHIE